MVLHALQELGQAAHSHIDLLLVVISTVHTLEDILGDVEEIAKRVLDGDSVTVDLLNFKICGLGEVLLDLKLLRIPEWISFPLNWLSCGLLARAATTTNSCAQDVRN